MFRWFGRKEEHEARIFDSPSAAFRHASEMLDYPLLIEATIPALVERAAGSGDEGEACYTLRLAGKNGGRQVIACTLPHAPGRPEVGDMVGYTVVQCDPERPEGLDLLGYISSILSPVLVEGRGWRIARDLRPPDLKPTLRL